MKTYHLKDLLKKDLLIVELPENGYYEVFKHGIYFKDHLNADRGFIEGSYTLLGSPDEIKDEDAEKLFYNPIDNTNLTHYANLRNLFSLLESEIYWENSYGKEPIENLQSSTFGGEKTIIHRNPMNILWNEAESRTFDRNRSIILVKN